MPMIVLDIPAETYRELEVQACQAGTTLEAFTRTLLETALHAHEKPQPRTPREILQAAGRVRPLSDGLRAHIIPGVSLDEVREALTHAAGPSLSAIIQKQRGPRP